MSPGQKQLDGAPLTSHSLPPLPFPPLPTVAGFTVTLWNIKVLKIIQNQLRTAESTRLILNQQQQNFNDLFTYLKNPHLSAQIQN